MGRLIAPLSVDLAITARCGLRCRYCHFFGSPNEVRNELTTSEWVKVLHELSRMKVLNLNIAGGEPLKRDDLPELLREVGRGNSRFRLFSSGIGLGDRVIRAIAGSGRCDCVQISLDGPREVHDSVRGEGSFASAVEAMRRLKQAGIPVVARISVGMHNQGTLREAMRFLVRKIGLTRISVNLIMPYADNAKNRSPLYPDERSILRWLDEMKALRNLYPACLSGNRSAADHLAVRWPQMIARRKRKQPPLSFPPSCPAPREKLAVRADGAVAPCNHLSGIVLGSVREQSLAEIWRNSEPPARLAREARPSAREYRLCRDCGYSAYCAPGCPALTAPRLAGRATFFCLERFMAAAPDYDFENMRWRP